MSIVASYLSSEKIDWVKEFWVDKRPRDFFKSVNHILFALGEMFSYSNNHAMKTAIKSFSNLSNGFNSLDLVENVNDLRNRLFGKNNKDLTVALSDVVNSSADTISWFSSSNIIKISAYASNILTGAVGVTLTYSFLRNTIDIMNTLATVKMGKYSRNIKEWELSKSIAYLAMGILVTFGSMYGFASLAPFIVLCSSITLISNAAIFYSKKDYESQFLRY